MPIRTVRAIRLIAMMTTSLLVVVYAIRVWSDFIVKAWKVGWSGEPLTFFSSEAIVSVVILALAAFVLAPPDNSRNARLVRRIVLLLGVGAAVSVVLGVLVKAFGLLS